MRGLEEEIEKLRKQLSTLQSAKPIDEMTVDDFYAIHPDAKARFIRDMQEDNWSSTYDDRQEPQEKEGGKH